MAVCMLTLRMAAGLKATLKVFLQCFHSASLGVEIMLKCLGASCRSTLLHSALGSDCLHEHCTGLCLLHVSAGPCARGMATCRLSHKTMAAGAQQAGSCMNTVDATLLGKNVCRWTAGCNRRLACCSLHASYSCRSRLHVPVTRHALHATRAAANLPTTDFSWLEICWTCMPLTHHFDDLVHPGQLGQGWHFLAR